MTWKEEAVIRTIKIVDIGYIAVCYMTLSLLWAFLVDKGMGKLNLMDESRKSIGRLIVEFIIAIWVFGVLIYISRNIVEKIPFPLDHWHGFSHDRVKELHSGMVFSLTFLMFSNYYKTKIEFMNQLIH